MSRGICWTCHRCGSRNFAKADLNNVANLKCACWDDPAPILIQTTPFVLVYPDGHEAVLPGRGSKTFDLHAQVSP